MTSAERSDVVVIGAGIAGASAAWALGKDVDVTLVELEQQPGFHATGRSAAVITETSGPRITCALASASRSFLANPPHEIAKDSLLSPRGLLWIAADESVDQIERVIETSRSTAIPVDPVDAASASAMVPVLRPDWIAAAAYESSAMSIDVGRLLDGFVGAFRRQGGTVCLSSPAIRLERLTRGWRVVTPDAVIDCDTVVNAAGAWADEIAERAGIEPVGLIPHRRTAFTFPVEGAHAWPLVMDAGGSFYFEPEGPGLLVSPADETPSPPCDARADEIAMAHAVDALAEATTLVVRGVRSKWAGLRTFAPDRLPIVGEDPTAPGFFWLAGQGGAGIKTSPAMAQLLAALVQRAELPSELEQFGIDPTALAPARLR